ncbi:MAG TPA: glycosyltransferase [Pyrinomonadaceae bacterium]|nr:glycosyltransferase [Pyrinomonadaceae bacterium]
MKLSIIIPAFNEEKYLPATLMALKDALDGIDDPEVIVVDNASTDGTRGVAESFGSRVVDEAEHNIATVRNTGAANAAGDVLVFIDADTLVRPGIFERVVELMDDPKCFGGSGAVIYEPIEGRPFVRFFMKLWPMLGKLTRIRGGALQFCRKETLRELGGYDPTIWVGEDLEFHWRLDKLALKRGGSTSLIESPKVMTSSRRWQQMSLLPMIFFTHPVTILLAWRVKSFWKYWYDDAIR